MFLISKIVRGRRLLHQLEQEMEKEKAQQKEREKNMATKVGGGGAEGGGGGGSTCQTGRSSRQQQMRQNSVSMEEQHGGASGARNGGAGGTEGTTTAPAEHYHRPFCACPSASSAVSAGAVEAEYAATGSIELNETAGTEKDGAEKPFSSMNQQKITNKTTDVNQRRQRAVRQRTDSSLPSVDEELTAGGINNAKMRRTSSMPSVVEAESHGEFAITKKGAIQRPIKHYNYEDRLSKLHKRALRFTWQRLQTRNGGKRIETVFEEVFDRMMRSFPVMREMFNTRTFISAMSRCEIASPREHARLIVKMFESAIKNLEVEERKRTDTSSDFDPNLMGRSHGVLRPYGFTSALWEAFGEAVIDVVLNQEAVRDLPGASQAWVVLTACLVDQLRAGFDSSRECPFQKTTQQQMMGTMNGTGGGAERDGTMRQQQQQICRKKSDKSSKNEEEEERGAAGGGRDNEAFLAINNSENRRNTIASCSDNAYTDEEEEEKVTTMPMKGERKTDTDGAIGRTTTPRRKSIGKREQRYFSVIANKTGTPGKLEMKILHDMASTEL